MSVQVSYKKQGLFVIMMLVILFLVVEGVSQILWYDIQNNCKIHERYFADVKDEYAEKLCFDYKHLEYTSENIRRNLPDQHLNTLNINSLGFRGSEVDLEKIDNKYRIMMVGGSTTFGLGATSDNTTIPALLEKKINEETDFNVNVINAGIIAASSREEVFYITNDLINFNPDLILVFDGYNDSFNVKLTEVDDSMTYQGEIEKSDLELFVKKYFKFLAIPNVIYQYTHDYTQIAYLTEKIQKENSQKWVERWNKMCQISEEKDFELMITVQPMLGTSDREMSNIEEEIFKSSKHQKTVELLNKLGNSLKELECDSIDLRETFNGINQQVFFSSVHTGDFGNKIIAEKIYEKILPVMIKDIKK